MHPQATEPIRCKVHMYNVKMFIFIARDECIYCWQRNALCARDNMFTSKHEHVLSWRRTRFLLETKVFRMETNAFCAGDECIEKLC